MLVDSHAIRLELGNSMAEKHGCNSIFKDFLRSSESRASREKSLRNPCYQYIVTSIERYYTLLQHILDTFSPLVRENDVCISCSR